MSLLQKWAQAIDDSDVNAMSELLHDDFEFTLHSAGKILSKQDVIDWVATDDIVTSNNRILYENDEVDDELDKAEQEFFETIISMILYLNKNGIRLDAVREMIQMKVEDAFAQYPKLAEDCQWKNRTDQHDEDL